MRVALIGNMNNNHFALMRYLVDAGIDAHLLLYNNEYSHFSPHNDTWEIQKWEKRIHKLKLDSYGKSIYYKTKRQILKEFGDYDIFIGNGFAPGYFFRIGLILHIFLPYDYYVDGLNLNKTANIIKLFLGNVLKFIQRKGLTHSTLFASALSGETQMILSKFNNNVLRYGIPMVYLEKSMRDKSKGIQIIVNTLKDYELVVFSHVSHIWKNQPGWFTKNIKSNNILIEGFAKYRVQSKSRSVLVLVEYGPDVPYSKELITSLGIDDAVIWLKLLSRKEILLLLDWVHIGCGELGGALWGGTGWEFMSKGVPFFQYVDISPDHFKAETEIPFPPILNVNTSDAIKDHLLNYEKNPQEYRAIGLQLRNWFDDNGGLRLAEKYRDLIITISKDYL